MYVAVKGGKKAVKNSQKLVAEKRRGTSGCPNFLRIRSSISWDWAWTGSWRKGLYMMKPPQLRPFNRLKGI